MAAAETTGFTTLVIICVATTSGTGLTESGKVPVVLVAVTVVVTVVIVVVAHVDVNGDMKAASEDVNVVAFRQFSSKFLTVTDRVAPPPPLPLFLLPALTRSCSGGLDEGMEMIGPPPAEAADAGDGDEAARTGTIACCCGCCSID